MTLDVATALVKEAVLRAIAVHSTPFSNHHEAYAVIREEFEQEYWPLVCVNPRKLSHDERVLRDACLQEELVQTAAMCIRALVELC